MPLRCMNFDLNSRQVLRQGTFIDKMHALGWTSDSGAMVLAQDGVLQVVLARYHAYVQCASYTLLD
jgi:hypothetical protein